MKKERNKSSWDTGTLTFIVVTIILGILMLAPLLLFILYG